MLNKYIILSIVIFLFISLLFLIIILNKKCKNNLQYVNGKCVNPTTTTTSIKPISSTTTSIKPISSTTTSIKPFNSVPMFTYDKNNDIMYKRTINNKGVEPINNIPKIGGFVAAAQFTI